MYQAALKAYENVNKTTMSGREIEAEVLTKAALRLKACQAGWAEKDMKDRLKTALTFNQRIWAILQAEIEKPDNPLPGNLKTDLLRLSAFIDRRTLEMIAHPSPEKLTILININHNIAAGLRMRPKAADTEKAAA